jgi:hypothetical protein
MKINSTHRRVSAVLILCALIAGVMGTGQPLYGQSKTGTTIGQFLLIEPSARSTAMGNAAVASTEELLSAYYNPGAIGAFKGYGVQFTHSLWLADITYDYAAASVAMGTVGNLYVSATALNSGEIAVRTVDQPLGTGEKYSVNNIALGIGYGRQLTDRFTAGFQVNFMQETIWHSSLSTFTFNVGTVYTLSGTGMRIGASISNFGIPGKYSGRDMRIVYDKDTNKYGDNSNLPGEMYVEDYPLPVMFRAGIDWPIKLGRRNELHLAVNAFHPNDNTESISFGGEWLFMQTLALRAGYQNLWLKDSEVGLTLGTGIIFELGGALFHIDYAWADHGRLENTQRFTLGLEFE